MSVRAKNSEGKKSGIPSEDEDLLQGVIALAGLILVGLVFLLVVLVDRCTGVSLVSLPLFLAYHDPDSEEPWRNPPMPGVCLHDEDGSGSGDSEMEEAQDEEEEESEESDEEGA